METADNSTDRPRRGFLVRNGWIMLLVVALVGGMALLSLRAAAQEAQLDEQQSRISRLEGQITTQKSATGNTVDRGVSQALGVTPERVQADTELIQSFLGLVFTWDSGKSYDEMRASVQRRYKLGEKDAFMRDFIPPAKFNVDSEGKRYYYIDGAGLSSSLPGKAQVEVVKVSGDSYEYVVIARVSATTQLPDQLTARANRLMLLHVTVDGQGRLTGLRGVPPSGATRTSG